MARSLRSGRVWLLTLVYLLNTSVTYGIFLWLPRMLQDTAGPGVSVSLYTAIPFMAALVGMVLIGRHSDKTGERKLHVAACAITAAVGLFLAVAFRGNLYMLVLAFTICQIGQRSVMSVFWAMPPMLLGGTAAAAGIALINAIGNLGGFFGPTMMGWLRDVTGGYSGGLLVLAGALILEAMLVACLRLPERRPRWRDAAARWSGSASGGRSRGLAVRGIAQRRCIEGSDPVPGRSPASGPRPVSPPVAPAFAGGHADNQGMQTAFSDHSGASK